MLERYVKYRWEFLRRNQEYIDDWNELQKTEGEEDKKKYPRRVSPEEKAFCKKWRIRFPLNPAWGFKIVLKKDKPFQDHWPELMLALVSDAFVDERAIKIKEPGYEIEDLDQNGEYKEPEIVLKGKPTIEIDFAYSDNRLVEEFKFFLESYRDIRELIESSKKGKYHFDNFDMYLKVYDLKQEGKSWTETERTLGLNRDTARNHWRSARRLIKGGW